jgi:chromosome segregation and condensation protein ScpB
VTPAELGAAFEAILFASHRPLKIRELQAATGSASATTSRS